MLRGVLKYEGLNGRFILLAAVLFCLRRFYLLSKFVFPAGSGVLRRFYLACGGFWRVPVVCGVVLR